MQRHVSTRNIALVAILGALYYVLSLISPFIPFIGLPDLTIKLEALMAAVFGLLLGPYLGALAALLGAGMAWALPPVGMNPLSAPFLLSPPLNALIVGFIFYRKWKWAFAALSLLIVAFIFLPPSQPLTKYCYVAGAVLWDKVIALLLIIPSVMFSRKLSTGKYLPILFFFVFFIGNQADNMWGADIFAVPFVYEVLYAPVLSPFLQMGFPTILDAVRFLFTISPFVYPAIRLLQAIVGTIVAVPLYRSLKTTPWILQERSIIEHQPYVKKIAGA